MTHGSNQVRDALATPDTTAAVVTASVVDIAADGTISIDAGAGPMPGCPVLASYTPVMGDSVQAMRRDESSWLVLGTTRTANTTTQTITRSFGIPYNVLGSTGGASSGTLVVPAQATGSWRSGDGWSQTAPYQGAYSAARGLYTGCYFYGADAFSALAGRTAAALRIHLHRHNGSGANGVGDGGPVPQWLALHAHPTQLGGQPTLVTQSLAVVSLSDAADTADVALPTWWGQALIDRRAAGVAHYAGAASYYSRCKTVAEDATTGRLSLDWRI